MSLLADRGDLHHPTAATRLQRETRQERLVALAWPVAILAIALAVRLALLPYASQDTNDHTGRIFIAWRWAEDPFLFLHGRWPTLHFLLVGPVITLFDDAILAPVLLHVAVGALVPVVLYLFAEREFGNRNAALAVGIAYALYPVAIRTSLEVLAQPWFSLCLALTLLALSRAREAGGDWRYAAAAGVATTLGALLRVEGWALIPFLALVLWPKWAAALVFVAVAMVGPGLSMLANAAHYGDPLFQINAPTAIMVDDLGGKDRPLGERLATFGQLVVRLIAGLTPLLAILAGLGALSCLVRRERQAVWLLPLVGLVGPLMAAAASGTLLPKPIYTEAIGLLLIPYLAAFLRSPMIGRLPPASRVGIHGVLYGSMVVLLWIGLERGTAGAEERSRLVRAIPAISPVPTFAGRPSLEALLPVIRLEGEGEALIIDALRSPATFYLGLHSLVHPSRIYLAPGQPYIDLEARLPEARRPLRQRVQPLRDSDPPELDEFVLRHCAGVLVLNPGSRFADWVNYRAPGAASIRGVDLALSELARIPWPAADAVPARAADVPSEVIVFRYTLANCPAADRPVTAQRAESRP